MKPGTLVMKIGMNPDSNVSFSIPIGTIGEIVEDGLYDIMVGNVSVYYPRYPSWVPDKSWQTPVRILMPISDPDIEIEDIVEEFLSEKV